MIEYKDRDFGENSSGGIRDDSSTERCPHCSKPINPDATVCPHCNLLLHGTIEVDPQREIPNRRFRRLRHPFNFFSSLAIVAVVLWIYGFFVVQQLSGGYYLSAGNRAMAGGDFTSAIGNYQQAAQNDSQNPDIYEKLGWAEYELSRDAEALAHFETALSLDPDRVSSLFGAGVSAYRLHNYERSITHLSRLIEISPEHAGAYQFLGLAEYRLGDYERSYEHLNESWVYNPKNPTTIYYLARILAQRGEADLAIKKYTEAEVLGFDAGSIAYARGLARLQTGEYELGRDDLQRALIAYPARTKVYISLAKALYLLKDFSSARDQLTMVQGSLPSNLQQDYLALSGWIALRQGNPVLAQYHLNLWVALHPGNVEALNALGWAAHYAGNCQMANSYFQSAAQGLDGEWIHTLDSLPSIEETPWAGLELQCQ